MQYHPAMPGRNVVKVLINDSFYHLYNRGVNRQIIYQDSEDFLYFEWLLARKLSLQPIKDKRGRNYTSLSDKVTLSAYCLMPNHFHLLAYQTHEEGIAKLLHSLTLSYAGYFNKKYMRRGPLFENTYRAVRIESEAQLIHTSRYIHLNPAQFRTWPYSSLADYTGQPRPWVSPDRVLAHFPTTKSYLKFTSDYEQAQRDNEAIKREIDEY